jgi:hypothetical protein
MKPHFNLADAIRMIEAANPGKTVSSIIYEDGTGKTFVYSFVGETQKRFIRLA